MVSSLDARFNPTCSRPLRARQRLLLPLPKCNLRVKINSQVVSVAASHSDVCDSGVIALALRLFDLQLEASHEPVGTVLGLGPLALVARRIQKRAVENFARDTAFA